jgi:hypothetical protein
MEHNMALDEHRQIQELRKLWSGFIMDWMRVGIPVGGAIFGFFSYLASLEQVKEFGYSWLLPLLGWLIFIIPTIMWRIMAHHIDRQIVEMYPRMLELERQLGWKIHATYFYDNLRVKKPKKFLEDTIKKELKVQDFELKHLSYRQYEEKSGGRENAYEFLLKVWDKYGHRSETSRGHIPQDWAVAIIAIFTFILALLLVCGLK